MMSDSANNLILTLKPDNVSNTSLVSQHGDIVYTVMTEHTKKATTTYVRKDAEGEPIASLEWRDVRPDRVSIAGNKPISLGDWMKRSAIPFKDDISFVDDQGRKYKWKGNSAGRSFELYAAEDNYTTTIARFRRSRRVLVKPTDDTPTDPNASTPSLAPTLVNPGESSVAWMPATLTLAPRAQEIQDTVVTAFLFLEKARRINENESQNRGDILGTPMVGVGTSKVSHNGGV